MLPVHLALVSLTPTVGLSELATVSAAIQKQLTRDFGPLWTIEATIDPFARLEDVPLGYWKIHVVNTFDRGGQHRDRQNQPYALVAAGSGWSLVASHEALEMLVDPFGNRLVAGPSPVAGQGRVEFLVEVCDPCQDDQFAYTVNDVLVSDFYTEKYFDPVGVPGVRYSFTGAITSPHQVLEGGYLTWREPTNGHWFQLKVVNAQQQLKDFGVIRPGPNGLRMAIDRRSGGPGRLSTLAPTSSSLQKTRKKQQSSRRAMSQEATDLRQLVKKRHRR
jgi:hypothetical protein